jgi:hypothetical protein
MKPVEPEKRSRRRDLMNRVEPDNEFTQWRLRSRSCAVADVMAVAAAISLYAVAGIDSVVSWPSNQVLLSDPALVRIAIVLLAPTLVWLIVGGDGVWPGAILATVAAACGPSGLHCGSRCGVRCCICRRVRGGRGERIRPHSSRTALSGFRDRQQPDRLDHGPAESIPPLAS